jgi:LemA protein
MDSKDTSKVSAQSSKSDSGPSPVKLSSKLFGLATAGLIAVSLVGWVAGSYNKLVTSRETVNTAWSALESDYQRRSDLVPNLVSTVKGAANFEQSTLTQVVEARAKATSTKVDLNSPESIQAFSANQGQLSGALSRLLVSVEAYPTLTATQNFKDLQGQLEGTENRIAVARKDYSAAAKNYNVLRSRFPAVLIAGLFGFKERTYFEAESGADKAPKVDFSGNSGTTQPSTPATDSTTTQ